MRASALPSLPALSGVRVLVVDPDEDSAEVLAALLTAHGALPVTAKDHASALGLVATFEPNVIVAELVESDGAFLRTVRACYPGVLAVALTSYVRGVNRRRAFEGGFNLFLAKPLDVTAAIPLLAARLHRDYPVSALPRTNPPRSDRAARAEVVSRARALAGLASTKVIQLSDFLTLARQKNASLRSRAAVSAEPSPDVMREALEELHTNEEELRVADEQLREGSDAVDRLITEHAAELTRYQRHLDQMPDGFAATDTRGNVQQANAPLAALLNVEARFLIGKPLVSFVARADCTVFRASLGELAAKGHMRGLRVRLRPRRGGVVFYAELNARFDAIERVARWTVRDVDTLVHEAVDLRQQLHDAKAALAANVRT